MIWLPPRRRIVTRRQQRGFFLAPGRFGAAASDPYWSSVKAMLPLNGANGSTAIVDATGRAWTTHGGAAHGAGASRWYSTALSLDGGGDYIGTAASADFAVGTGDFDVCAWFYLASSGDHPLMSVASNTSTTNGWILFARHTSGPSRVRFFNAATGVGYNGTTTVTLNAWHFLQMRRIGTLLEVALDGVIEISQTIGTNFSDTGNVWVGASRGPTPATHYGAGWIADYRFTKGVGRPLAVPTGPLPTS